MNKTELIAAVAEKSGISKKDAEKAVSSTIETIINTVAEGEKIQIAGFGTFEQRQRNARTGCDPRTGKSIEIPASKVSFRVMVRCVSLPCFFIERKCIYATR